MPPITSSDPQAVQPLEQVARSPRHRPPPWVMDEPRDDRGRARRRPAAGRPRRPACRSRAGRAPAALGDEADDHLVGLRVDDGRQRGHLQAQAEAADARAPRRRLTSATGPKSERRSISAHEEHDDLLRSRRRARCPGRPQPAASSGHDARRGSRPSRPRRSPPSRRTARAPAGRCRAPAASSATEDHAGRRSGTSRPRRRGASAGSSKRSTTSAGAASAHAAAITAPATAYASSVDHSSRRTSLGLPGAVPDGDEALDGRPEARLGDRRPEDQRLRQRPDAVARRARCRRASAGPRSAR